MRADGIIAANGGGLKQRLSSNNASGYRGVHFNTEKGRWKAIIGVDGGSFYLGVHRTPEQAALAYNAAARFYHGASARLNVVP